MADWKLYKGEGPWLFAPQQNKWGYLNNPRWMEPPSTPISYDGREDEEPQVWDMEGGVRIGRSNAGAAHYPCGHWHRGEAPAPPKLDVNLFRVTDPWLSYGSIQSIFFNHTTKKLSLVSYYVSTPGVCAIECPDNQYILTIEGMYDSAKIVVLDRYLNVIEKSDIFNYYDCMSPRTYHLNYHGNYVYWASNGYSGEASVIGRFSYPELVRDKRFSPGGVFYGSDSNLWQYDYTYSGPWGSLLYYPITGIYYSFVNNRIPDNDHSGNIATWGVGTQGASEIGSLCVKGGTIYCTGHASPNSLLYAYDDSFNFISRVSPPHFGDCVYRSNNGNVYIASGTFDSYNIARYTGSLSYLNDKWISGRGRVEYHYSICDIGDYIAVASTVYTGYAGLTLFTSDLTEVSYKLLYVGSGEAEDPQCIISSGNFLFVGENNHVSAYELSGTELVFLDRLHVYFPDVDIGHVSKWMKLMTV